MEASDGPQAAKAAGLRYTTDALPGIRRLRQGRAFRYVDPHGAPVRDEATLARIRALAVPPAYQDVWISPLADGHLQATGRDARGRKQYRYHKRWRAVRDENKFDRMLGFAKALPTIRAAVSRDLALRGLPREKLLATLIALLEATAIRIGNDEYARENDSYGLTTLRDEHAAVRGATIRFHFRGKSGKVHDVAVHDRRIARIVAAMHDLPGQHLFEYLDEEGAPHPIHSDDVNAYLREVSGEDFTAKDFRTWEGTMSCALKLAAIAVRETSVTKRRRQVADVVSAVADQLGNTPAVCRKSYIFPGVIDRFIANGAIELAVRAAKHAAPDALHDEECAVVALIETILADESRPLADALRDSVKAARKKKRPPGAKKAA
ncbi:MAG: DNA topoisomerase IB [Vulcanimicrobiaceae bacterium]|jgi:DNA topoisomerase-1